MEASQAFPKSGPVLQDFKQRLPATLELTLASLLIALVIGIPLGVQSAVHRDTAIDHIGRIVGVAGVAMPTFWTGLLALYFFFYLLGVAPSASASLASRASPITYVDSSDPPFLFVHGLRDDVIAPRQSRLLHDALRAAGVPTGYVELPNAGHGFPMLGASRSVLGDASQLPETCTALSFLRATLGTS